jgi:L-asparagine transporter-like permease
LTNRHVQFITIGGTIGTGLFLSTGNAILIAGPSIVFGYIISGFFSFLIIRQLGEMTVHEPVVGSIAYFANKYCGEFIGFFAGWNYWVLYIMIGMAELTGMAAYVQHWFPDIETWKITLFFLTLVNITNIAAVKIYAEIEFLLTIIKTIAICTIILIGIHVLIINPGFTKSVILKNLYIQPINTVYSIFNKLFPRGIAGFITAIPIIIFSFGGIELTCATASETINPKKTIPTSINKTMLYILLIYILSTLILSFNNQLSNQYNSSSPFVVILNNAGFKYTALVFNFIVLVAALSVYNCCIYNSSRTIYGLSIHGNAPKIFIKTTKKGTPIISVLLSVILTLFVVPLNYFIPNWQKVFKTIIGFIVTCAILNWIIISMSHIMFKKKTNIENKKTSFSSPFYPYANYVSLFFIFFIIIIMLISKQLSMTKQIIFIPVWITITYMIYRIYKIKK